jgi:hypothetical protein
VDRPGWLAEPHFQPVLDQLMVAARLRANDDLLDPELAQRVADSVGRSVWVRRVLRVTKLATGVVRINCEFRTPTAWVQRGQRAYLVDDQGAHLPLAVPIGRLDEFRPTRAGSPNLFLIRDATGSRPSVGQVWPGQDLQAALRLCRLMNGCVWRDQVQAISVANYGGRQVIGEPHIVLLLGGSQVRWGRAPGEEMGVEIPAADKIAVLQGLYAEHGRIDAGRPHVDIRFSRTDVGVPAVGSDG